MRSFPGALLWHGAYRAVVRSSFATVPLYRQRWATADRTVTVEYLLPRLPELAPLSGGDTAPDPRRGRDHVLAMVPGGRGPVAGWRRPAGGNNHDAVAHRRVSELTATGGVLHDPVLGYLGGYRGCGRWHLDWRRVYVRATPAGLAFTLLRQRSPRLVDVLVDGGVPGTVATCPRHRTPVLLA